MCQRRLQDLPEPTDGCMDRRRLHQHKAMQLHQPVARTVVAWSRIHLYISMCKKTTWIFLFCSFLKTRCVFRHCEALLIKGNVPTHMDVRPMSWLCQNVDLSPSEMSCLPSFGSQRCSTLLMTLSFCFVFFAFFFYISTSPGVRARAVFRSLAYSPRAVFPHFTALSPVSCHRSSSRLPLSLPATQLHTWDPACVAPHSSSSHVTS